MVDILDEARQELREEKLKILMHKYGKPVLLALVLLFGVGIIKAWYNHYQENIVNQEGALYYEGVLSLRAQDLDKSLAKFSQAASGKSNYAALSDLNKAALLTKRGEIGLANQIYQQVSANKNFSADLHDYSRYMTLYTSALLKENDKSVIIEGLDAYLQSKPIFACSAMELKALLFADLDKRADAARVLTEITKDNCSEEMVSRARRMQVVLSLP